MDVVETWGHHFTNSVFYCDWSHSEEQWRGVSYPGLQLRGELGLEVAHSAVGIISLNEDFGSDGCLLPHVLQAVGLWKQEVTINTWSHVDTRPLWSLSIHQWIHYWAGFIYNNGILYYSCIINWCSITASDDYENKMIDTKRLLCHIPFRNDAQVLSCVSAG